MQFLKVIKDALILPMKEEKQATTKSEATTVKFYQVLYL